jgi:hypothetical protein
MTFDPIRALEDIANIGVSTRKRLLFWNLPALSDDIVIYKKS